MNQRITPRLLESWCERWLNGRPIDTLLETGHLSAVYALELNDGRQVVIKVRPPSPRIAGCTEVQYQLWKTGFPCPQPLAGPAPFGRFVATAEAFVPDGEKLSVEEDSPRLFAEGLAHLVAVALAPNPASVRSLEPPPPWVWWQHTEPGVWPVPDDRIVDLNSYSEPHWLDQIGDRRCPRQRLQEPRPPYSRQWRASRYCHSRSIRDFY
jgi:hypothetical protein